MIESVAPQDSLTEFPELFDWIVMKLVRLFDNETGFVGDQMVRIGSTFRQLNRVSRVIWDCDEISQIV